MAKNKTDWPAIDGMIEGFLSEELRSLVAVLAELDVLLPRLKDLGRASFHLTLFEMRTRLEGVRDGLRLAGVARS